VVIGSLLVKKWGQGHLAGDFVLREPVELLKKSLRNADVATRCWDGEFAVLLSAQFINMNFSLERPQPATVV
jgi:GGDEF domain-containing protein